MREELVHFIDLSLWYGEAGGMPRKVTAFGGDPASGRNDRFSIVLEWAGGARAVLNQCLGGFKHHTVLKIADSTGAPCTWWNGPMDRTTTPIFDSKKSATGLQACRSNVLWKGFASPPKNGRPRNPGLQAGVSNRR